MIGLWATLGLLIVPALAAPPPVVAPPPPLPPMPVAPPVSDGVKDLFYVTFAPPHVERRAPGDHAPPMKVVARVVHERRAALMRCYESSLKSQVIVGRAAIRVQVKPNGEVEASTVAADTVTDSAVAPCLARAIRGFAWPRAAAPYAITLPFVFQPAQP